MPSQLTKLRRQVRELKLRVKEAEQRKSLKTQRKALRKQRGKKGRFADFVRKQFELHPEISFAGAAKAAKKEYAKAKREGTL